MPRQSLHMLPRCGNERRLRLGEPHGAQRAGAVRAAVATVVEHVVVAIVVQGAGVLGVVQWVEIEVGAGQAALATLKVAGRETNSLWARLVHIPVAGARGAAALPKHDATLIEGG